MPATAVILSSLRETMGGIASAELNECEEAGWRTNIRRCGDTWLLAASKDGVHHRREFAPSEEALEAHDYSRVISDFRDEVTRLVWDTRRQSDLVVGVVGKWRKWGRAS